jgi:hypothetical protein
MSASYKELYTRERLTGIKRVKIDTLASGNTTIVAAVANKIIRVYGVTLISAGSVVVKFQSNNTTDICGPLTLGASTGFSPGWSPVGQFQTAIGELLNVNLSAAIQVGGWLLYGEV